MSFNNFIRYVIDDQVQEVEDGVKAALIARIGAEEIWFLF
jgi:hypothetical protein